MGVMHLIFVLISRSWGCDVREIGVPVHVWHGDRDTMSPVSMSLKLAQRIPDSRLRLVPTTGHLVAEQAHPWHRLVRLVADAHDATNVW